ncbi:LysM peptidoglycan-binding domain-containing protein [Salipaludibacillus agaradhaerens]|jgi:hypothetical protein|uniref:LysM peptidoglycan-binding domain-containing protein n=1 Tax=Salipaludibacillus agaradhaerens TaxID=76935 RepID=UPI002151E13E|nr:LysM peptidoglycan-binding domain-containing protein [Salipaludibacillus agaradhaerens]MCR6108587.1 LysM peptidoglycan-binding domain-containing protein [Salipaludibacillus agaradhaerens]MCR6120616.1 LysM peptidoglycan-binding domain-containing protein [Salipaludibacillus agaradhaerens]
MSRKRTNKTAKVNKLKDKHARQQPVNVVEARVAERGVRTLSGISIAAAIGSLLFLAFFFSSDIRGNILSAKVAQAHAEQKIMATTEAPNASHTASDILSELSDPDRGEEDIVTHLIDMSDEEFDDFINTLIEASRPERSSDISAKDESFHMTLEDAYTEAEKLYPGQIDGSKRLKLVEDLNATGYMYYVAEEGDTLIELSRAFSTPLGQLIELNGIHDADVIPAGMILLFPSDTPQPNNQSNND